MWRRSSLDPYPLAVNMESPVRPVGRFAPSPTGALHLGHLQTLLLGWLQIRAEDGRFLLRIEDIDRSRRRPGAAEAIVRDMSWFGFDWDEGPGRSGPHGSYFQSERIHLYEEALASLSDRTFRCTCSRKEARGAATEPDPVSGEWPYPGTCRPEVSHPGGPSSVRVLVESQTVGWDDRWLGPLSEDPARVCGDFILWNKAGDPAYQLAVVVDDIAMGVTEVLRGEDLLHSTARQILLYRWLGGTVPRFSHVPLRTQGDGQKLAKSRGSEALALLREKGRDPRSVLGDVAVDLGLLAEARPVWPHELIEPFRLSSAGRSLRTTTTAAG